MNDDQPQSQPPIQWPSQRHADNDRAADLVRRKVDQLYTSEGEPNQPNSQLNQGANNSTGHANIQPTTPVDMQQYHTAWQSYYQEYFQRYYSHAYKQAEVKLKQEAVSHVEPEEPQSEVNKTVSELKQKLRQQVDQRAKKVKKSRHFKPVLAAVGVGLTFMFINYNQVVFGSVKQYLSPSSTSNTPLIVTPNSDSKVDPKPVIIIPKIAVNAPVVYDEPSYDDAKVEKALERGTVHYGTAAMPGQNGNVVIMGHSSNNVFAPGDFKYVFVNLDRVDMGDTIYLNYQGVRYTYKVTVAHKVIEPTDLSVLANTKEPILTLITCTPAGTNLRRLIVQAKQISPNPDKNKHQSNATQQQEPQSLPATSKSIWGNFF